MDHQVNSLNTFRFLHLTDLHVGTQNQSTLWPNVEELFLKDLKYLHENVGPWDMVLFTGDLTQKGIKAEFDKLEELLIKLWSEFKEWGFTPELMTIPGNHDLIRPTDASDPALILLLNNWRMPEVQSPFWDKADSQQRLLIHTSFQEYSDWWSNTSIRKPALINHGILLRDCSASFNANEFKIGILGLNSAYLHLNDANCQNLHIDVRQFHAACNDNGVDWVKKHDLCLLLTHHPDTCLSNYSHKQYLNDIYAPPERFALHLFGHKHESNLMIKSLGGDSERKHHQGPSLFGLEHWGENKEERIHGYSLCEFQLTDNEIKLRIWPRIANKIQGGGLQLVRDYSYVLDDTDGGTKPIVVKQLASKFSVPSVQKVTGASDSQSQPSYDPRNPPFYVPYRQKGDQVIGRKESLDKLKQQLTKGKRTAIGQTAVFQGLGGLGKTQLAVEYAYQYKDTYPNGVIWLNADQDLDAQLVDLAVKSYWVAPVSEHKFKLEVALHRLRSYSNCLIIFDNLEDRSSIENYLPEPQAEPHIIVTSRSEQADFTYVPIDVLDSEQSLSMLIQEAGRQPECEEDLNAAKEIAKCLGGLPLALELAGAYLSRRLVDWKQYLELLQYKLKQALPNLLASLTRHDADLYSTLQISETILDTEPLLRETLDVLTWSGSAPMGQNLLSALVGSDDPLELTSALGLGTSLRILQHTPGTDRYALHRLVREVRREQKPLEDRLAWASDLCIHISKWFATLREDFTKLSLYEAEIDHLKEWHDHSQKLAPKQSSCLTWLQAYPPFHRGQPKEIKRLVELAFKEYEQHGCSDRELLAHLYNDLAYSVNELGDPKHALDLDEHALAIWRALFGEIHRDTAISLNNIAGYISLLGDPQKALELAQQALNIQRQLFGENHTDTLRSLVNIANYYSELNDFESALKLSQQALDIRLKIFGEYHPDTARSITSVASHTSDPKRALELDEQALVIRMKLFGAHHPETARSLHCIAIHNNKRGDAKQALKLNEQALSIQLELLGEYHPDTANSLHNMAIYLSSLGKPHQAYEYASRAYEIKKQILGTRNHSTLGTKTLLSQIARQGLRMQALKKQEHKKR